MFDNIKELVVDTKNKAKAFFYGEEEENDENAQTLALNLDDHRYPSFSALLPYQYFDKQSKVFFNTTNAGLLYRIIPLTGGNEKIAEQLDSILRTKISDDFTLQCILVKHNQVGNEIDAFSAQFSRANFENMPMLGEQLSRFYKEAAKNGFDTNTTMNPRLTQTECFVVVDKVNKGQESDIQACFGQFRVSFEAALGAAKIGFHRGDANDLLHLLQFYVANDPNTIYSEKAAYEEAALLKHQVLGVDFDLTTTKEALSIHGVNRDSAPFETAVSVLTIDKLPDNYHLWDNINNTSNVFEPNQNIACNHIISVVYIVDEQARAHSKANRKTRDLDKKSKSDYALNAAGTEEQARSWRGHRDELASQKTRSVKMLYNVVLFSRPEERAADVESAISVFSYNGIKLGLCKKMQLPYFLSSMPFLFTGNLSKDFALPTLMFGISSWNATQYMPLLADWSGTGRGILLPTMRGQWACIDPFSDSFGTNYNMAVTGTSGGGKSFFIQMMLLNVLFNGGSIFIIDVGGSYRKLCEALNGVYLEYDNLAMNPFTHVQDIWLEIDDIIALFELLACPQNGATDDDRGTLRQAILTAFDKNSHQTTIDDVQAALLALYDSAKDTYPTGRLLSKNLERYASNAEHGKAFNKASAFSLDARVMVVDLKAIEDNKSIRAPVLLSVISQYQRRMFDGDRSLQKMCIIDEAWAFFTGDAIAANFITKGFRTGRRHKASFVTITQGIEDYFAFSEARAAWENSALKLIFLQESLHEHQKNHATFTDFEMLLLDNFPNAKEAGFSQVLIKSGKLSSLHRLFVDPFTKVMLSSDGNDYQAFMDYKAQGLPFIAAVAQVAKEHYGVTYGNE
jgi:conjugal transfer ATP-binding protein TraC